MPLLFLIPFFTCLVTAYIFKKSTDEIGQLIGIVAVISLVLSLVLAPWQIQLLLLIVVLVSTKKLLEQNEYKLKLEEKNQEKINYRNKHEGIGSPIQPTKNENTRKYHNGNNSAADVTPQVTEGEFSGRYRGLPWRIHEFTNTSQVQNNSVMMYRGQRVMND